MTSSSSFENPGSRIVASRSPRGEASDFPAGVRREALAERRAPSAERLLESRSPRLDDYVYTFSISKHDVV